MSTYTNYNAPIGSFAEIGDDIETHETNPMLETDIDLTDEQFGYDRALRELEAYVHEMADNFTNPKTFALFAILRLRQNYKDEL